MTHQTSSGFILILLLFQAASQTILSVGNNSTSTTEATCGSGSNICPTDGTPGSISEMHVSTTASSLSQETTASTSTSQKETPTSPVSTLPGKATKQDILVTTPKPQQASSTTAAPSTPFKQFEEPAAAYAHSGSCACDLMVNSCDINCCCDQDCTPFQRTSFSKCRVEGYTPYDNRYCYASKLIFLNNSEHILQQAQNGAFCIVRSNLAGTVLYPQRPTFTTYQDFAKHWERSHASIWPESTSTRVLSVDKPNPYSAGTPVWVLHKNQIQTLELPSTGLTPSCSSMKSVPYLLPWSSQCIRKAPTAEEECAMVSSYFFHQINGIVRSPPLINHTQLLSEKMEPCPPNVCAPATFFICSDYALQESNLNGCKNVSSKSLLFGLKYGTCYGVVKRLKLILYHNGTSGIDHVEAYMRLLNVSLSTVGKINPLHQSLSVEFKWTVSNRTTKGSSSNMTIDHEKNSTFGDVGTLFTRSGNPGYIVGKPVIAGMRLKPKLDANVTKDIPKDSGSSMNNVIHLSHDPNQWITLPKSDMHGLCSWSGIKRHIVTFGEDLHMSCGVEVSIRNISSFSSCNELRARMLHLLLGDVFQSLQNNSLQSDWGRVVAVFGSANFSAPQDWTPLLLEGQPPIEVMSQLPENLKTTMGEDVDHPIQTCESVPLGIHIRIMHGFVGSILNPQSRIFGASLRFAPLQDIGMTCPSETCFQRQETLRLRVVSTVKFVDVSSPAVTRFAEPPAIHIRLPPDFFYPFMASENSAGLSVHSFCQSLIASCVCFLFCFKHVFFTL